MALPTEIFETKEQLRNYIQAKIVENNSRGIKEEHVNNIFNSVLDFLDGSAPGVYFCPAENLNSDFMVFASAILRPSGTGVHGSPITWDILNQDGLHNSSFFISASGILSGRLKVDYPTVKHICNLTVTPDESLAESGIVCGPSVGASNAEIAISKSYQSSCRLTGNGSGGWNKFGVDNSGYVVSTFDVVTGATTVLVPIRFGGDINSISVVYCGDKNYSVKRVFTGLPGARYAKFYLIDTSGNVVTTAPTTNDHILLSGAGTVVYKINTQIFIVTEAINTADIFNALSNFWIFGLFECWMVARRLTNTSVQVCWQTTYPSATNYKIYRDTSANFDTQVLIHTGMEGVFVDKELTPSTLYHYKMVAVIGGVDNDITTFTANTF
ncbi:MAG: hypothetical protein M9904_02385 [Chitinophagaceae bacterium]|nr:hypothetical protein [Chitinophagaceae bacterium]